MIPHSRNSVFLNRAEQPHVLAAAAVVVGESTASSPTEGETTLLLHLLP